MKKSFCLIAVLCLLGNVAYAFDIEKIPDVLKHSSISSYIQEEWQSILDIEIAQGLNEAKTTAVVAAKAEKEEVDKKTDATKEEKDAAAKKVQEAEKMRTKRTVKRIRPISVIKQEQFNLQSGTDSDTPNLLKSLKDEEYDYNKKAAAFAGFQRALANVYRYKLSPSEIIKAFVEVFYE
ncbi:MAG: hypothetical protein LBC06_02130 [Rickettsiales bacterium]|jgi:hypothetical protein|nr:hypothetical protein [Rickettsiales bacterium]